MLLEEMLMENIQLLFKAKIDECLDDQTWTLDNRNDKLSEIYDLSLEIGNSTEDFIKRMLDKKVENTSLVVLSVQREMLIAVLNILQTLRNKLDELEAEEIKKLPYSYEWLTESSRILVEDIQRITRLINDVGVANGVEEL
jgi:hypothetical protein